MSQFDRTRLLRSPRFHQLIRTKKRLLIPLTLFFLAYTLALPICTSYFSVWMNSPVFGVITLAWVFAFSQFLMTLLLSIVYLVQAKRFDRIVDDMTREIEQAKGEGP
ncbi:DUF485 domain-containing protein [Brevibacillus sp. H7]|uniref:DUF485 domain-containing protein n=1 Tax=Brevibacillus sp. H7 TaxID=3349138 RepID=UPI00381CD26A